MDISYGLQTVPFFSTLIPFLMIVVNGFYFKMVETRNDDLSVGSVFITSHETQGNWLTLCKKQLVLCSSILLFYYVMYNCEMSGSVGLVFIHVYFD